MLCLLRADMRQTEIAKRVGVSQSFISRLWSHVSEAEKDSGHGRSTTTAND